MRGRSIRMRLTVVYGGLFLATSTALLVVVNVLLHRKIQQQVGFFGSKPTPAAVPTGRLSAPAVPQLRVAPPQTPKPPDIRSLPSDVLAYQWAVTAILVVVLTVVSVGIGWWVAGRLLRPLHRITATARRLSLSNLHERIRLAGPEDELKELADTFDGMLDRLDAAVDSQRRFAANASHELRTPLAIQRAAIQIGLDSPSPERLARVREELLAVNRRSERLIDGLLLLAQGEQEIPAPAPLALDTVVRQAITESPTDGVHIHTDIAAATVTGDAALLNRLVANLVHNAIRYNHRGGRVDVTVTADRTLTVRNTGPHVPHDRVADLFEPFYRLDTDRTRSAASPGLGLSIVAAIARAHHAVATARPNPGGGLTLTVRFPPATEPVRGDCQGAG